MDLFIEIKKTVTLTLTPEELEVLHEMMLAALEGFDSLNMAFDYASGAELEHELADQKDWYKISDSER